MVDSRYSDTVDSQGDTLIPPTLYEFATTFAADLSEVLGIVADVANGSAPNHDRLFLTLGAPSDYTDGAGRETSEGYSLTVNCLGVTITGASPLGVWWGTRTVLQQAILHRGLIQHGSGTDSPGWGVRGQMLDAGRHFYPKEFLVEMCAYMSFFKQNTFHIHLSDNLYNNPNNTEEQSLNVYARFRLWSDSENVDGLNKHKNESYTRDEFQDIQTACAARGVTVLPEIEAPGHALVIVQWKPQIGYSEDLSLLNITHPETIPAMKTIWEEFLPWFHTKVVSIGADEYTGPATDYNDFVNEMDSYIGTISGKSIRIWGTFPPVYNESYNNIYQNVSIQHWEFFEDDPYFDYILNNYSVVNSNDDFYIVNKWGIYPNTINLTKTFYGSPTGSFWRPYIFDQSNATRNPSESNAFVLGAIEPLWNDYGPNASVYSEAFYAWRDGIPALADKQWGGNLSEPDYHSAFAVLQDFIPGQNLDRAIRSLSDTIFNYTFQDGSFKDSSPNGYDPKVQCLITEEHTVKIDSACALLTPLASKGRNYTLSLSLKITSLDDMTNTTLVSGADSSLMLTPNITLFASGSYYRLNTSLPLDEWIDISLIGRENRTYASAVLSTGETLTEEEEFLTMMGINGQYYHWAEMAIEAPLKQVGGSGCGWSGALRAMSLSSKA